MNKLFTKITSLALGAAMMIGVGVSVGSRNVSKADAATSTYKWNPTTKISSGTTATYNTVEWTLTTGNAQGYQSGYGGLQYGTKNSPSYVTLTTTGAFAYENKTLIKSVTIYANTGGAASVTDFKIGGTSQTLSGSITSNSQCGGKYTNASALTFTSTNGVTGAITFTITGTSKACYFCGIHVEVDESSTPACDHTYGDWVVVNQATCTEAGSRKKTCSKCGDEVTESIPALGHDYGEWTITTNPTCTESGEKTRVCSRDSSHTETESIPALGHNYVNGVCTVCGATQPDELTFPFTSNPGGWPITNQTTLTDYVYALDDVDYTFQLKNVKQNSGYLMLTKVAVLGLPSISGKKLTSVVASNSNGCSTSVKVGISDSATEESYVSGGESKTWSTQGSSYTYELDDTEEDTVYYLYVTSANAQITELKLGYETVGTPGTKITMAASDISMQVGQTDYLPIVTNASTHEEITGFEYDTTSTDANVITIVSGKVHAVGAGSTTLKITHADEGDVSYRPVTINVSVVLIDTIQSIVTQCAAITSVTGVIDGTHTIQGTVTGLYGNHFMIQQGDYAMYIYTGGSGGTDYGVALNDVVRVTGTFGKYNKWIETRSLTSVSKVEGATPETISPYHATNPADLTDVFQNRLVTFTGLTWVSGTYTAGTSTSITFKDANNNTIYLRTDSAVDDAIEAQIATKIKAISDDEGKTLVVDLVGVHYTVFYSSGTTQQQFKVTNADKISYHTKTATDEEIVDEFVEERLKWTTYDPEHREGVEGDNLCLGADGYYMNAKNALTTQLTERQQNLFKHTGEFATEEDKYAAPRARYEAWALAYGDTTPYAKTVGSGRIVLDPLGLADHNPTAIIIIVSVIGVSALGGFFFLRKRKEI